jgi:glycine betaine/choline ABC-type transport system substrate-binding protein
MHRNTRKYTALGGAGLLAAGALGTYAATSTASTPHHAVTAHPAVKAPALPGTGKPTFVLGDKNFPEEFVLGDLYAQALQAQGYTIKLKANIGSTEVTYKALGAGDIDGYPEYDGTLLAAEYGVTKNAANAAAAAAETKTEAAKHGYVFTNATPFSDSDAIAVLTTYAKAHGLHEIDGLGRQGKKLILAGAPEFATRYPDGLLGLERIYHVHPTFKPTSIGDFYTLLDDHKADAVEVFTTDPELKSSKYTVLADEKHIFGFQNVGMVIKASVAKAEGSAFTATINKVSALLTSKAIISLNAAVQLDQQSPASVAKAFLKANHLL